jgi:hypothetical protein
VVNRIKMRLGTAFGASGKVRRLLREEVNRLELDEG